MYSYPMIPTVGNRSPEFIFPRCTCTCIVLNSSFSPQVLNVTVSHCEFRDNEVFPGAGTGIQSAKGGAFSISESTTVVVEDSGFFNNIAQPRFTNVDNFVYNVSGSGKKETHATFHLDSSGHGGAGYVRGRSQDFARSFATVRRCAFENNTATSGGGAGSQGGALHVWQYRGLHVVDCNFTGNLADNFEDVNSSYVAQSAGMGGALFFQDSPQCVVEACRLVGNTAQGISAGSNLGLAHGGGMVVSSYSEVTVYDTLFMNNSVLAGGVGGAVSVFEKSTVNVSSSEFTGNFATCATFESSRGGAVAIHNSCRGSFDGVNFVGNNVIPEIAESGWVGVPGGTSSIGRLPARTASPSSSGKKKNCISTPRLSAANGGEGGAVVLIMASATFTRCTFEKNHVSGGVNSGGKGAGVSLQGSLDVLFDNCTFHRNVAFGLYEGKWGMGGQGGAAYVLASTPMFRRCIFSGNYVSGGGQTMSYGGAVALRFAAAISQTCAQPVFDACQFLNNSALPLVAETRSFCGVGGAIHALRATALFTNSSFVGNDADCQSSSAEERVSNPSRTGSGGAMAIADGTSRLASNYTS